MKKKAILYIFLLVMVTLLGTGSSRGNASHEDDHVPGACRKFMDPEGKLVTMMSRKPHPGDEIITAGGDHYRVTRVQNEQARVKLLGKDRKLVSLVNYYSNLESIPATARQWSDRPVAIYHTHSDESYLPTDGAYSIPFNGGIFQVGESFTSKLKEEKVRVIHDTTPHDPHDANAYYRSRRTAARLLKENPVALFDVHRDGVDDPEFYRRIVSQQDVAQIRLVVGRQNPKMKANLDFAKRLLAYGNKEYPGLLKEIYIARGNYNQDLLSTAILIEAGTYTNEKWLAQSGVNMLAQAVPAVLGLNPPAEGITGEETGRQGWKTALFLILLLTIVFAGFILLNIPGTNLKEYLGKLYQQYAGQTANLVHKIRKNHWRPR